MSSAATEFNIESPRKAVSGRTLKTETERGDDCSVAYSMFKIATNASRRTSDVVRAVLGDLAVLMEGGVVEQQAITSSVISYAQTKRIEALSEADFLELATTGPALLVTHIEGGLLRPAQLTFAAEALGDITDSSRAERALIRLTEHDSALVREGAVYGLGKLSSSNSRERLRHLAEHDRSPGVREAAFDVLAR